MLSQNTLKSYHKTQIDWERLAPAVQIKKYLKSKLEILNSKMKQINLSLCAYIFYIEKNFLNVIYHHIELLYENIKLNHYLVNVVPRSQEEPGLLGGSFSSFSRTYKFTLMSLKILKIPYEQYLYACSSLRLHLLFIKDPLEK